MNPPIWQFEHAVLCRAKKAFVWSFWTDVSNWERIEGNAVDWIRLDGDFEEGSIGTTKNPGQDPIQWKISQLVSGNSATIEMPLAGAMFYNTMSLESTGSDQTLITQRMSLTGANAAAYVEGMKIFEENAPKGLAKLAKVIEDDFQKAS